ncbi:Cullin-5 [Hypsibius exemplaris]|uniref:Cullin-5 n=1 Tax=Hypsibius exemplaris TaxID=2072580 RepID=A0A1W0X921_HYPEX|nr:Cullin-5 [Hypsibius exemplaris]
MNKIDLTKRGLPADAPPAEVYKKLFQPQFTKILKQHSVPHKEWQELFYDVYNYMLWYEDGVQNLSVIMFEQLNRNTVETVTAAREAIVLEQDDELFLRKYVATWTEYFIISQHAHLPFLSVDNGLLEIKEYADAAKADDIHPIRRMLMTVWNEVVLTPIASRLLQITAKMLVLERDQGLTFGNLITGVRDSFYHVTPQRDFFVQHYESVYISTLEHYYTKATADQFANGSVIDYARWAEITFRDEQIRAKKYLVPSVKFTDPMKRMNERLVEIVLKETRILDALTCTAFQLIEEHRSEPLGVIYRLMDRIPATGLEPLVSAVQAHIIRKGKDDMVESAEIVAVDPEKYVEKLLNLYNSFLILIKDAFGDDHRFTSVRDLGFQEVVNDTTVFSLQLRGRFAAGLESRCPDMLASFCDSLLRKTNISRRLSSEEISERLKRTLQILKYVTNKDVFIMSYQITLARRLILGLTVDMEIEEEMCKWLQNLGMPAEVINRMVRMFGDIRVSEDLSRRWTDYVESKRLMSPLGDVDPKVLNVCSWSRPGDMRTSCTISPDIEEFLSEFERWYAGSFQGRKLALAGSSCTFVLEFTSAVGRYDLEVTMFQAAVLRAFRDHNRGKLTFEALQTALAIPDFELRKTLWGLCTIAKCGNRLMGYAPAVSNPKEFDQGTRFWINMQFAPVARGKPQKRGRINLIGKLQIGGDRLLGEEDTDGISALRELRIQEAVTKVMKTRKKATMTEIHTETIELLKNLFMPNKKMLKEQIEFLIDKEYLTRDERDLNVFHYVA